MKLRMQISTRSGAPTSFEHAGPVVRIGRDSACELALGGGAADRVSRRHARIDLSTAGARLSDTGSSNGTFVNGRPVKDAVPLHAGDRIQLGRTGATLQLIGLDLSPGTAPRPPLPHRLLAAGGAGLVLAAGVVVVIMLYRPATAANMTAQAAPSTMAPSKPSAPSTGRATSVITARGKARSTPSNAPSPAPPTDTSPTPLSAGSSDASNSEDNESETDQTLEEQTEPPPPASSQPRADSLPSEAEILKKHVLNDFASVFRYIDANRDGSLDEEELAKAFRGPKARPYAQEAVGARQDADNAPASKDPTRSISRPRPPRDLLKKYPDFVFLMHVDKDNDGSISRAEYDAWAEDMADVIVARVSELRELQQRLQDLELEVAGKTLPEARKAEIAAQLMQIQAGLTMQMKQQEHLMNLQLLGAATSQRWGWWFWIRDRQGPRSRPYQLTVQLLNSTSVSVPPGSSPPPERRHNKDSRQGVQPRPSPPPIPPRRPRRHPVEQPKGTTHPAPPPNRGAPPKPHEPDSRKRGQR
jgi:hypothetical protein